MGAKTSPQTAGDVSAHLKAVQSWVNEGGAVGGPCGARALRILLVEDDAIIAVLIAETLESMGHEVCAIAANEADAVTAADRERPDLLIVDAHLDQGSGLSAVRTILLEGPLPHIFMSGDVLGPDQLDARAILLQKPFQERDLARAIIAAF